MDTVQLICVFVFAYTKIRFSHDTAQIIQVQSLNWIGSIRKHVNQSWNQNKLVLERAILMSMKALFLILVDLCLNALVSDSFLLYVRLEEAKS